MWARWSKPTKRMPLSNGMAMVKSDSAQHGLKRFNLDEQGPTVAEECLGWGLQPLRSNVGATEQTASSTPHTVCSWSAVDAPGFYCGKLDRCTACECSS